MKRILLIFAAIAVAFSASAAKPKKAVAKKAPAKASAVQKAAAPVETAHRKTPYVGAISVDAAAAAII